MSRITTAKLLKFGLLALQIIVFIFGIIMIIAGSAIQGQINSQKLLHTIGGYSTQAGSIICIIFGILILLMAMFGIFATVKDHHRFLIVFSVVMSVIFVIQFITGITGLSVLHSSRFDSFVEVVFKPQFTPNTTSEPNESDFYQKQFKCCGFNNYTDWIFNKTQWNVPESCCINKNDCSAIDDPKQYYNVGCEGKLRSVISSVIEVACGILVAFSIFNFGSIILSVVISNRIKRGTFHSSFFHFKIIHNYSNCSFSYLKRIPILIDL
jgi:hypothetical protein